VATSPNPGRRRAGDHSGIIAIDEHKPAWIRSEPACDSSQLLKAPGLWEACVFIRS
jgi:hypothetical protein